VKEVSADRRPFAIGIKRTKNIITDVFEDSSENLVAIDQLTQLELAQF
jgi:hypothetical protein